MLQICLAHDVQTTDALDGLHISVGPDGQRHVPDIKPSPVRQIVVPTTLASAEFSNPGAATEERTRTKHAYMGADIGARAVILDPAVTVHTLEWLWHSTGVRGIDHVVETLCSIDAHPYCDGLALHALRLFRGKPVGQQLCGAACLPAGVLAGGVVDRAGELRRQSRHRARFGRLRQSAAWPHELRDLPHVMRFNEPATRDKQRSIAEAMGRPNLPAADAVGDLIARLGQPTTLRAVGVERAQLPKIAEASMQNLWVRTNPQPLRSADDVMKLLEAAW